MDLYNIKLLLTQGKSIYDLPLRVTYYARVSTDREEQINSLENQIMYFEKVIKEQDNWVFVNGYIDEGISGTSALKREQFLHMINDAKNGKFDLILTKEISRFSRSTLDSIKYTQKLLSYGIGIHFLSDNINTFLPDSELRLTIMSSIAQEEVRKLSERVKFGYERSVEKGIVGGNDNIYGYKKNKHYPGKLFIHEEEAEMVRLIFKVYIEDNIGGGKLGLKLYDKYGYKNSKGKPIHGNTIREIIRNPKYKGYYCANKSTTVDYRTKQRKIIDKEDWVMYKDEENVPAIVSEEVWEKANKILNKRSTKHSSSDKTVYYRQYPLSKKVYCYHDDATYIRGAYKLKNGKRIYWGCNNYRKHGKHKKEGCNTPIIYEEEFAKVFRKIINHLINNQSELTLELTSLINESTTKVDGKKDLKKLKADMATLEKDKEELLQMRIRKEINLDEFNKFRNKINKNINEKTTKLSLSNRESKSSKKNLLHIEEFKKILNTKILNDDEAILKLGSKLFDKIYIERTTDEETSKKATLHIKLNILDYEKRNHSLSNLALLFPESDRCISSNC